MELAILAKYRDVEDPQLTNYQGRDLSSLSKDALLEALNELPVKINGIPIGIPATIRYKKPIGKVEDKTIYAQHGVETFIVLPYDIFRKGITNFVSGGICQQDSKPSCINSTGTSCSKSLLVEENSDSEVTIEPEFVVTGIEYEAQLQSDSEISSSESIIHRDVIMEPSAAEFTNFSEHIKDEPSDEDEPTNSCKARRNKKSKVGVEYTSSKLPKIKLVSEDEDSTPDDNRRKSSRIKSKGFRPDFKAVEHIDGISDIENSESDDDKQTDYEVDDDWVADKEVKMEVFAEYGDEYAVNDQVVHDSKCFDGITDGESKLQLKDTNDDSESGDPDFCPEESFDYFSSFSNNKKKRQRKDSEEDQKGSVNDKQKVKRPVGKCAHKTEKKKPPSDQPNSEEADTDVKPPKERIKINICEHPDKYDTKVFQSMERQHRSKPKEEISMLVYVCKLCNGFQTKSKDVLENHIEQHINGDFECKKCDFNAKSVWHLTKHTKAAHSKNKTIVCHLCGMNLQKLTFKPHMGRVHNDPQYNCNFCPSLFALKREQNKHENTEHGDKTNWCSKCHQRLPELDREQFASHTASCVAKVYPCEKCGKTYSTEQVLKSHVQLVHTQTRWHPCPKCSFMAKTATSMTRHLKTHDGIHPYRCYECPFSCVQAGQLKSHMRTHSGDKPYKCSECNYAASWNVQLKDHKKFHGLPTAVMCKECGVLFKDGRNISMHLKKSNHNSGISLNDL